jgi:hypothetical protein
VSASFDRVSRITAGSLGIAGLVLGGLAYSSFSAQAPYYPAWWYTLALVIHLGLPSILGLLSFAAPLRLIRAIAAAAAIGQLAVLVSLIPVLNWQATPPEAGSPWMLANTALAAASAALAWGGHGRRRERLVWALIISLNVIAVPVRAIGSGMWLELSLMDALVGLCFCAVFGALVLWMYYTIAYVPGGQPIGALERVFSKLSKAVRRWLPGRRIQPGAADDDDDEAPAAGAPA